MFFGDSATNKREGKSLQRLGLTVVLALSAFLKLSWLTRGVRQRLLRRHRQEHARQLAQLLLRLLRRAVRLGGQAPFRVLDPGGQRLSVRLPRVEPTASPGARGSPLWPCSTIWWAGALGQ
jgi:hypothetical protein